STRSSSSVSGSVTVTVLFSLTGAVPTNGQWLSRAPGAEPHPSALAVASVDREAGEDVEAFRAGGRVVEAVADGHHALDVAGAADDVMSLLAGSRPTGQGDHTVGNGHVEPP